MKTYLVVIACLGLAAANASSATVPPESCEQIRAEINAQVGVLPKVNTELLRKLGSRSECHFTAAEVYRSAYGDKPMPRNDSRGHRSRRSHHDDD